MSEFFQKKKKGILNKMDDKEEEYDVSRLRSKELDSKIKNIQQSFKPDYGYMISEMPNYKTNKKNKLAPEEEKRQELSVFDEISGKNHLKNADKTLADCFTKTEAITTQK